MMNVPIEDLTPKQIVAALDRYIIGQNNAKRAVAVALRNRYRRQQLPESERDDILPKNILMIGPTGVGKTEIARRLAQLARAPFIKVEATKFTEVGYVGRDVESMIRDLAASAARLIEREKMEQVRPIAEKTVIERIADLLMGDSKPKKKKKKSSQLPIDNPLMRQAFELLGQKLEETFSEEESDQEDEESTTANERRKKKLIKEIQFGKYDHEMVEVEVQEQSNPFVQVFTSQGLEEMGLDAGMLGNPFASKKVKRKVTVAEAKKILLDQEARKAMDQSSIQREAVLRTEQSGIIFLDEIDKIASKQSGSGSGPDVSREGVQRDLLPIIEGSTVATKLGPIKTDHILFIAAGAFYISKPSDLIPELQGRLPIRVELENLSETDFRRILLEPQNALVKQYQKLLQVEGVHIEFADSAIDELARFAQEVNEKTENIGARRLHTLLEKVLDEILYEAPDLDQKKFKIDADFVKNKLGSLVQDTDLSRYIL